MPDDATVFVIDDDMAVRESLRWLLESVGLRVEVFANADALLDRVTADSAGCLLLDVRLPGMSGLDLQQVLHERGIDLPIIIITGHGDVPIAVRALKGGAMDFIEKPFNDQMLLDRVRDALERDRQRRAERDRSASVRNRIDRLTPRERQVMDLVVQGKLNKQIAAHLGLSHKTIEVHRAHIMRKMEADSVATLVRLVLAGHAGS